MKQGSVDDFLIRVVLDDAFRELAQDDPDRAFEGYDLSEREREILRAQDHGVLGLLGEVVTQRQAAGNRKAGGDKAEEMEESEPATSKSAWPELADVELLLRLRPKVTEPPGSEPRVSYEATLQPWPCEDTPGPGSTGDGQDDAKADTAGNEVKWIIRIGRQVVGAQDAELAVAYSASIHPLMGDGDQRRAPTPEPDRGSASPPWNHHVESSAAKTAAQAVRDADADQRYARLIELAHALQTGDGHG
jgi:hypothetical protein